MMRRDRVPDPKPAEPGKLAPGEMRLMLVAPGLWAQLDGWQYLHQQIIDVAPIKSREVIE